MKRRRFIASLVGLPLVCQVEAAPALPSVRILPDGWGEASLENMPSVIQSTMQVLWPYFPGRSIEPIVVNHVTTVPMVHYERTIRRELQVDLATEGKYWSQISYQFAHEFCHILSNFDQDGRTNLWFEETLCETASLFTLRRLTEMWKKSPPQPEFGSYAKSFAEYADTVIRSREKITPDELPTYYRRHAAALRQNPTDRARNGAMAAVLLQFFEQEPEHWEAVTWLNSRPSPPEETFEAFLNQWLHAMPNRHKAFGIKLRTAFGIGS